MLDLLRSPSSTWIAAAGLVLVACSAGAQDRTVTCAGTVIDVWVRNKAEWPLAVIYAATSKHTCSIDRTGSGHDPLGPCSAGEKCRVTGTYKLLGIGDQRTYSIQTITSIDTDQ